MTGAESLSTEDATLLCATAPEAQLQIGALCRSDGPPLRDGSGRLRVEDLRSHVGSRLHLVPRFRQRVVRVPFDLARPAWVDDEHFDLHLHVRTAELPAPGSEAELRAFVGELLGQPLDPDRPLWDLWLIDGLDGGDVAVLLRAHHVLADGLSLLRAAIALLDVEAQPATEPDLAPWTPGPVPGRAALLVTAVLERRRNQLALALGAARGLLDPRSAFRLARSAVAAIGSPPHLAPALGLTGRVGSHRDFLWTSLPLEPLRRLGRSRGVTLNDIVLTVVADALRRVLDSEASGHAGARNPIVLVPVGDAMHDDSGNSFSFMVAPLPVDSDGPDSMLQQVHDEMHDRKASGQSSEMSSLFSVVDVVPIPLLRRLGPELLARQPLVNLAVTNIPGSDAALYLMGSELKEMHPFITGVGNIACIIGVLSYRDQLGIGITVDADVVADADGLLAAVVAAADELLADGDA